MPDWIFSIFDCGDIFIEFLNTTIAEVEELFLERIHVRKIFLLSKE